MRSIPLVVALLLCMFIVRAAKKQQPYPEINRLQQYQEFSLKEYPIGLHE